MQSVEIPIYTYFSLSPHIYSNSIHTSPSLSLYIPISTSLSIPVVPYPPTPPVTIVLGLQHHIPLIPMPTKHKNPITLYSSLYICLSFKLKMLVSLFYFFLLLLLFTPIHIYSPDRPFTPLSLV